MRGGQQSVYLERMRRRAGVVAAVRQWFAAADFLEVDTPVALSTVAPELHIEAPEVMLALPEPTRRFLQTSPELPMKRLLAAGFPRIYQIAAVFRDGDLGPVHRPEFRLLEWYRRDEPWSALLADCEGLLRAAALAAGCGEVVTWGERRMDLRGPFDRISVDEAFRVHAGFSILDALQAEALRDELDRLGLHHAADDGWDDLYHRVFLSHVEPALLARERPLFLTRFPAPLCSLARLASDDPRVAERFELYAGGLELANGFGELTDPEEQRRRFIGENALRVQRGLKSYPLDERFLATLAHVPPCAGIALGLERLLMPLLNAEDLDGVSFIPWGDT